MTTSRRFIWLIAASLTGSVACAREAPDYTLVIGPTGFTALELGALGRAQQEVLGDLTAFGLAVSEGRLGEVARPFVEAEQQELLLQKLATEIAVRESGTDEAMLRQLYRATPEPELEVRHLVVLSERWRPDAHRDSARARAAAALARIQAGEAFETVAADVSDEPGAAERGGLLQPGRRGDWVREFWVAAESLSEGQVSDVVETEYGFHVLKLEERRAVPFEEVRSGVLTRLVDLTESLGRAREWADRETAALELHDEAVRRWREGGPDALSLATWPGGGSYTGQHLRRYLLTVSREDRARVAAADDGAFAQVVASAARNALLADRAEDLGITLSAAERAAGETRWRRQVQTWAATLGFMERRPVQAVRDAAVEALGSRQQSVQMARSEVADLGAALRYLYPVSFPGDTASAPG